MMLELAIVQVLCFLISIYLGRHDAPACDMFVNMPWDKKVQALFHGTMWKIKFGVILMAITPFIRTHGPGWIVVLGICLTFWMWPTFNVALNLARKVPKREWDYISPTSNLADRTLTQLFGKNGGKALCIIAAISIVACNIFFFIAPK